MAKKGKNADEEKPAMDTTSNNKPTILPEDREKWVILDFRLLNWKYMNFTKKMPVNSHIFSIKVWLVFTLQ